VRGWVRFPVTVNKPLIQQSLRALFPDPAIQIGPDQIDSAIKAMVSDWRPEWETTFGVQKPDVIPGPFEPFHFKDVLRSKDPRFYLGHATHTRVSPIESSFTGELPMVRVPVPATGEAAIDTSGGTVFAGDTVLYNLQVLNQQLDEFNAAFGTDLSADSADFLIPPRLWGARFGAIGIILIRQGNNITSYGLLPGMATGEARLTFIGPKVNEAIVRRASYEPTPFSKATNWYLGNLRVSGDQVETLNVEVFEQNPLKGGKAHLRVSIDFEEQKEPTVLYPGLLTVQAACRVCLLAQKMKRPVPGLPDFLRDTLAEIAKGLDWNKEPA